MNNRVVLKLGQPLTEWTDYIKFMDNRNPQRKSQFWFMSNSVVLKLITTETITRIHMKFMNNRIVLKKSGQFKNKDIIKFMDNRIVLKWRNGVIVWQIWHLWVTVLCWNYIIIMNCHYSHRLWIMELCWNHIFIISKCICKFMSNNVVLKLDKRRSLSWLSVYE